MDEGDLDAKGQSTNYQNMGHHEDNLLSLQPLSFAYAWPQMSTAILSILGKSIRCCS